MRGPFVPEGASSSRELLVTAGVGKPQNNSGPNNITDFTILGNVIKTHIYTTYHIYKATIILHYEFGQLKSIFMFIKYRYPAAVRGVLHENRVLTVGWNQFDY